jgi:hypothetical protein
MKFNLNLWLWPFKFREPRSFKWRKKMFIMDSVEEYARCWTKSEGEELDALSEWITSI